MKFRGHISCSFRFTTAGIQDFMTMRDFARRAEEQGSRAARRSVNRLRSALRLPVICIHDEEEQEPEPVKDEPIVSVDGKDIGDRHKSAA